MSTVSTGGAPLAPIGPNAAKTLRHAPPASGDFEALLPSISAELAKGRSRAAQPGMSSAQNGSAASDSRSPDHANIPLQPESGAAPGLPQIDGDHSGLHPSGNAAGSPKSGIDSGPVVPDVATTSVKAIPSLELAPRNTVQIDNDPAAEANAAVPVPQNTVQSGNGPTSAVTTEQVIQTTAVSMGPVPGQTALPPATAAATKAATPVINEIAPQSDDSLAAQADRSAQTEATPLVGTVVAAPTPIKSAAAVISQAGTGNLSNPSVETGAGTQPSPANTAKTFRAISTTRLAGPTDEKRAPAEPQPDTAITSPPPVATARLTSKPQSDTAKSSPSTPAGTIASAAQVFPSAPPGTSTPTTMAAAAGAAAQTLATSQSSADNSSPGTVAPVSSDGRVPTAPPLNPINQLEDDAAISANADTSAQILPAVSTTTAATAPQSQSRDARSDPVSPTLYPAGTASPTAPTGPATLTPSAPAAPPTATVTQQVAIHVAQSLNEGTRTVTVELHPAELGRVEIHLSFHSDGMNVRMTVDRPETFEALSHDRGGLQQQLTQAGVDLGGGGLDLRLGQQQSDPSGGYSNARTSRVTMPTPQPEGTPATLWVSNSLLDILA
jgi:flagellar hook-length control protein FliK